MIEGSGSVPLTNGSARPKNLRILRIRNTALEVPVVSLLSPGGAPGVLDQPVRIRPDSRDFDSGLLYIIA
jgi:hypothetical protein